MIPVLLRDASLGMFLRYPADSWRLTCCGWFWVLDARWCLTFWSVLGGDGHHLSGSFQRCSRLFVRRPLQVDAVHLYNHRSVTDQSSF